MATAADAYDPYAIPTRRMTRAELLAAARYFGVDPAGLDDEALRAEVKRVGEARWRHENAQAIEAWQDWEHENASPLDKYRGF